MKQSSTGHKQLPPYGRTSVAERIVAFLRRRHPVKMAECVAAELGVSPETVEMWDRRSSLPSALVIARMIETYGPEFLCVLLARSPAWLSDAWRQQKMDDLQARRAAIEDELRSLSGR